MNWRVLLLADAIVAVVLVGASLWVKDNPTKHHLHVARLSATTVNGQGNTDQIFGSRGVGGTIVYQRLADERARYLRFLALAVVMVTLASIPLLREMERRRA